VFGEIEEEYFIILLPSILQCVWYISNITIKNHGIWKMGSYNCWLNLIQLTNLGTVISSLLSSITFFVSTIQESKKKVVAKFIWKLKSAIYYHQFCYLDKMRKCLFLKQIFSYFSYLITNLYVISAEIGEMLTILPDQIIPFLTDSSHSSLQYFSLFQGAVNSRYEIKFYH